MASAYARSYPEPVSFEITEDRNYTFKSYGYNTRDKCEANCLSDGNEVGCFGYSYRPAGIAGTRVQVCNISYIKKDGVSESFKKNKYYFVTGIIDKDGNYTAGVPRDEILEAKGKRVRKFEPASTQATTCENCAPTAIGPTTVLSNQVEEVLKHRTLSFPKVEVASRANPPEQLPRSLNYTCNRNQSEEACHLCNCYFESRGEPVLGKIAVIRTVIARMLSPLFKANSACDVVYQRKQFSWTNGYSHRVISTSRAEDIEAFYDCKKSLEIAKERGPGTPYFFNPRKVRPRWARSMKNCADITGHRFVVPRNQQCPSHLKTDPGVSVNSQTQQRDDV